MTTHVDHSHEEVRVCAAPQWVRDADLSQLTTRELEVLDALGKCLSNTVIARRLCVAERTVKKHITSVFVKLDISTRAEAAVIATFKSCAERCPRGH
ncbi:DNA-binding response regulator [Streptomyces triticagri]|uniref:DNA-binding response regulator n=1 Tax=Streptomyces triticagri TaxID=2293568 RepID=A0A372M9J7_9ACTN|nr:LuxR C-terminal-related transcriptional regulator [Streptomyces triticagri]RFU87561.1 DNA-binding response regulator [Streptomyces triticagri]